MIRRGVGVTVGTDRLAEPGYSGWTRNMNENHFKLTNLDTVLR
jgi:hypothetical protein